MPLDVVDLRDFYGTDLGMAAKRLISARLRECWRNTNGSRIVGIGFAGPYLSMFRQEAELVLCLHPATQGVLEWPDDGPIAAALVDDTQLPLSDGSIDRILAIHLIEEANHALDTMREIWRVLAPGGTVLFVIPNRRGTWARSDATPFGHGRPFSRSQLTRLLRDSMFSPIRWMEALYVPPALHVWLKRSSATCERVAARLALPFPGVHIVEASKQVFRPVALRGRSVRAPRFGTVLVPGPAAGRTVSNNAASPPERN